ncbi:MAG: cysteine desulfurase NifS, partial [Microgenomates bacterium 39_7]
KVYLDYAATTPLDPEVFEAMKSYYLEKYANPASLHWMGQEAALAVKEAREFLASAINTSSEELIFTSSATESNNLALKGLAWANKSKRKRIIVSAVEHDCVLNTARWLAKQGYQVDYLEVDQYGMINLKRLKEILAQDVLLVSVIHANNEIGTIQPIKKIATLCHQVGAVFHIDASQTFGKMPLDVEEFGVDLLTTSAHKIYGPKGVSFLYCKKGVKLSPLLHGGGQELNLRSSTSNVPGIVGFAKAIEIALKNQEQESQKIKKLRDKLQQKILNSTPNCYLNGHPDHRLYNILNVRLDYIEGESLVMSLSQKGVAASTGSACSSPKLEPSHVLLATGLKPAQAHGSLRLSLGRWTTLEEVNYAADTLKQVVDRLRNISPFKIQQ